MTSDGWLGILFARPLKGERFRGVPLGFGDDLKGDLYLPDPSPLPKMPAVIWLHPFAYPTGYSRYSQPTITTLTNMGYVVLAFDQIGFGTRIHQATRFYERYPKWSLLGKMISDTRAAIDALAALEAIDASRIYVAGYSLGGKVALLTAALDDRIAGVIAASAFTPLRSASKDIEGLREYSHLHGLAPRLGFFISRESKVPVDFDEIIAAIAPRPVYIRAPALDRYAIPAEVSQSGQRAREVYKVLGRPEALELHAPVDFNRFRPEAQREAFERLKRWNQ